MTNLLRCLLAVALVLLPLSEALAGSSTITTKDAAGVTRTFFVTTDGGGNFYSAGVICDQSAAAACASVGTAGSPSTNALTVQAVTLGHGTAANAMRVELPTDGTGLVSATQSGTWNIGTVTAVTSVTNPVTVSTHAVTIASGGVASGSYASGSIASGALASGSMVDLLTMRQTVAAGTVAANSMLTGGQYNSTPITLTNTQGSALQLDANGFLKVNTAAGAAAGGTSSNFGSAFPGPGTAVGFSDGTNMVAAKVGAVANVAAATNMLNTLPSCNYNATPLAVTDTRYQSVQCDNGGNVKASLGIAATTLSGWTSATGGGTTQVVMVNHGAPAILLQLNQTSTISAGAITFQGTYDGTNWAAIPDAQLLNPNTLINAGTSAGIYTLVASTNKPFLILTQGYQSVRINLSTAITGSATITPFVTLLNYNPAIGALLNPLAAGSAIIGAVSINQTTPGTTNNVSISPLPRAARNFPGATVGVASAQALAASTAVTFLQIQNTHTANTIACAFGATAVLNSSTSVQLGVGQSASWGPHTGGVPTGALNCIASGASTPLYVEWL